MAVPTNKAELVSAINLNYAKIRTELSSVPIELTTVKELEGHARGTLISLNNLVAYLVGWGELVLKWVDKKDRNQFVDFPETGYKWNELGKLAQKFYSDYEKDNFIVLCGKLDKTVQDILAVIDTKSNEELYVLPWYEKWTLGRMIQFNTASPYMNATGRICRWKKNVTT
jgi:hypothetical protein